jgi:hypothetical protein
MPKPNSRAEAALYELCVRYGYCINGDQEDAIIADPPHDADAFLDAVLRAEGYEHPELLDRHDRAPLMEVVRAWLFDDGQGRGTKSGLPRVPPR